MKKIVNIIFIYIIFINCFAQNQVRDIINNQQSNRTPLPSRPMPQERVRAPGSNSKTSINKSQKIITPSINAPSSRPTSGQKPANVHEEGYLKFSKQFSFNINNSSIIINKNEILKYEKNGDEYFIFYGSEKIHLTSKDKSFTVFNFNQDITKLKSELVKKIATDSFKIDITTLNKEMDAKVFIYKSDGQQIDYLKSDLVKIYKIDEDIVNKTFRLAYNKMPSFIFSEKDFKSLDTTKKVNTSKYNNFDTISELFSALSRNMIDKGIDNPDLIIRAIAKKEFGIINIPNETIILIKESYGFSKSLPPWLWIILFLILLIISSYIVILYINYRRFKNFLHEKIFSRKSKEMARNSNIHKEYYDGGSLADFCNKCSITLDELIKLNKEKVPANYKTLDFEEQKKIRTRLKRNELIIKINGPSRISENIKEPSEISYSSLINQLKNSQSELSNRIESLERKFNNLEEVNKTLKIEKDELKNKIDKLDTGNNNNKSL